MRNLSLLFLCLFTSTVLIAQPQEELVNFFKKINWSKAFERLKNSRDLEIICCTLLFAISTMLMLFALLTNHIYMYWHILFILAGIILGGVFTYNEYEHSRYATQAAVYLIAGGLIAATNIIYIILERILSRQ